MAAADLAAAADLVGELVGDWEEVSVVVRVEGLVEVEDLEVEAVQVEDLEVEVVQVEDLEEEVVVELVVV